MGQESENLSLSEARSGGHLFFRTTVESTHLGQIDQIDDDLDNLDPNLPLWDVVQDLHSTGPTQETCPRSCRLYGSHPATRARSYRSYRSAIYLP